ncbi:hypothetical protein RND81_03G141400 [Saponaria officinalis]|uniref:ATPase AAA-type core domain-containing protein n=1 Tax=Saponaria officinalis TaxID=3572 RepID=A0AAW1M069_SAPOF
MANWLQYNVYDVELSAVKDNSQLKKLLLETSQKSIIAIDGIDEDDKLTGLLNFIDGCGEEKIVVITTNHIHKIDRELIRPGRIDLHIELSNCSYDQFLIFSKNYLDIEGHALFGRIEELLGEVNVCVAEVAHLISKPLNSVDETTVEGCLRDLISALEVIEAIKVEAKTDEGQS